MSLQDFQNKIYKQNQGKGNDQEENAINNSGKGDSRQDFGFQKNPIQTPLGGGEPQAEFGSAGAIESGLRDQAIKNLKREKIKKKILVGSIAAFFIILGFSSAFLYYFLKNRTVYRQQDVFFEINYPQKIVNGMDAEIKIKFGNFSKTDLKDVSISLRYPSSLAVIGGDSAAGTKVWDIGILEVGKEKSIAVPVRIFGSEGSDHFVEGKMQYIPGNFNSSFEKNASAKLKINSLPIKISLNSVREISSGKNVEYSVKLENLLEKDFFGLIFKVDFPSGFSLQSAKKGDLDAEDLQEIAMENFKKEMSFDLKSFEEIDFVFAGSLAGETGMGQIAKVYIGIEKDGEFLPYSSAEASTMIKEAEISVLQIVKDGKNSADWGETVEIKLNVKNTCETNLSGVVVSAEIKGFAVDILSLASQDGEVSNGGKVIWNSSNVSDFGYFLPSQEKELGFSFRIKNQSSAKSIQDKNFIVSSAIFVEAVEVHEPIFANPLDIKVNSKLGLIEKGFYWEEGSIKNWGPIPPKAGQTTTYTIHWQLVNWTNDLANVKVNALLPAGVGWSGNVKVSSGNIYFDNITRTAVWDVGNLAANTGVVLPVQEAVFQVSINPAESDFGKSLKLLEIASAEAVDQFTEKKIRVSASEKTTELREDLKLEADDYKVSR
ncbi:MAG: hypothetical protein V1698_00895 [bacterium]